MKKIAFFLVAPFLLFGAGEQRVSLVQTEVVEKAQVKSLQTFIGSVVYSQSAKVASQGSGAVVHVNFKEGQKVKKGQVLNQLDNQIIKAQITSSKASLNEVLVSLKRAKKDLARYETLIKQDAVSQSVYDDNYFNVESLENKIASLEANIKAKEIEMSKKVTIAPFDGVVVSKNIELGDWAGQGSVVAELVNLNSAQVEVNLPQKVVLLLKPQMKINIVVAMKKYSGYVDAIIPKGDIATRTFPVKLSFDKAPKHLFEGMAATIEVQSGQNVQALVVPRDAILKRFGQNVVFVDAKGSAMMIPVLIVGYTNGKVAVNAQGLSEGMRVVTKGNERIFPKSPLKDITKK
jgi:RND family efflux transporter MFP subunit